MLLGYARVGTDDHDFLRQRGALLAAGCQRLFEETARGARHDRPELTRLLKQLEDGDVLVITRLDRLAHGTRDLLDLAGRIRKTGAALRFLAEPWADTTSPSGGTVLAVFAGIAEFERAFLHRRATSGRVAAQRRGVRFGRAPKLGPQQLALARRMADEGQPVREVAGVLKCHRATLHWALHAPDWAADGAGSRCPETAS